MSNIPSKEIIAKLMAAENLIVEHANVPTASFDLINRRLLIPSWKDISDEVYTLLISHEVGHALYTPAEEWKQLVIEGKRIDLKQVVNVIEDVRIEKLIQVKYPGTVRAFRAGYDQLQKQNFFGTKDRSIDSYGLIDKINLHYKIGHYGYAKVPFSDDELVWVDKVNECKTFSDVVRLAEELLKTLEQQEQVRPDDKKSESDEKVSGEQTQGSSNTQSSSHQNLEDDKSEQSSSENSDSQTQSDDQSGGNNDSGSSKITEVSSTLEQTLPTSKSVSETQAAFEQGLQQLIDTKLAGNVYVNFGNVDVSKLIVDYKKVHSQISQYYFSQEKHPHDREVIVDDMTASFLSANKQLVNQLANLFEIKKRARLDSRSLTAKTGQIDTNKVHSYRYNEDIFKKVTTIPQGKSHGLLMFIDMSSSMINNMAATYEQLLTLVLFCRRINIPFDVYGFTDCTWASDTAQYQGSVGELSFGGAFCLRQYFSSKMSAGEFNTAIKNVVGLIGAYRSKPWGIPPQERLNQTPLVPTILLATKIAQKFRTQYNLDIINTIFLTDGDDSYGVQYRDREGRNKAHYHNEDYRHWSNNCAKYNFYIRDSVTKKQWCLHDTTKDSFNLLREVAGVKVIGFHLCSRNDAKRILERAYVRDDKKAEAALHNLKVNKYSEINSMRGYDAYYLLPSKDGLAVGSGEYDPEVDTTIDWDDEKESRRAIKSVVKDFNNFMKNRLVNRVFLNRFIEHIS